MSSFIDKLLGEMKNERNTAKMQIELIDPLIKYTFNKLFPYLLTTGIIFLLTFLLAIIILLLQLKQLSKNLYYEAI